jgi:DNA repair exonuclease SbcCD ATPase subunit
MKPRLIVPLLVAALLLVLGTIASACGGDGDGLTLEEYFQRIDVLGSDLEDEIDRLGEEFDEATEAAEEAETEEEMIEPSRDSFNRLAALVGDFVSELESIDPPSEVEDAHNEIVAAQAEGLDLLEDLNERAQRVESASDMEEVWAELEGPVFTAVSDRSEQACFALEAIADANGIDVDLECE